MIRRPTRSTREAYKARIQSRESEGREERTRRKEERRMLCALLNISSRLPFASSRLHLKRFSSRPDLLRVGSRASASELSSQGPGAQSTPSQRARKPLQAEERGVGRW